MSASVSALVSAPVSASVSASVSATFWFMRGRCSFLDTSVISRPVIVLILIASIIGKHPLKVNTNCATCARVY